MKELAPVDAELGSNFNPAIPFIKLVFAPTPLSPINIILSSFFNLDSSMSGMSNEYFFISHFYFLNILIMQ